MGTFCGHALPGSFFIIFGVWWTYCIFSRYYGNRARFTNRVSFTIKLSGCCRHREFPIEGLVKLFFCTVGIIGEVITAMDGHGHFIYIGNGQHATMFAFFALSGLVDLVKHYNLIDLPKSTDYAVGILCFVVEGVLFQFHLHGRSHLDITLHTLLLFLIWSTVGAGIAELMCPNSPLAGLSRTYFVLLQGTWFWQVGSILYPPVRWLPKWDEHNHDNIMLGTIVFAWHAFAVLVFLLVAAVVIRRCVQQGDSESTSDLLQKLLPGDEDEKEHELDEPGTQFETA